MKVRNARDQNEYLYQELKLPDGSEQVSVLNN